MWYVMNNGLFLRISVDTGKAMWVPIAPMATQFFSYIDAEKAARQHGGSPINYSD